MKKEVQVMELLFLLYLVAGYWAAGVVFYENKVVIHTFGALFMRKLCLGFILGIVIIPVAIIKRFFFKR
jgi:hypothetical protein